MAQISCPHCGFQNFAISAYCGRCERPLKGGNGLMDATTTVVDLKPEPLGKTPTITEVNPAPPVRARLSAVAAAAQQGRPSANTAPRINQAPPRAESEPTARTRTTTMAKVANAANTAGPATQRPTEAPSPRAMRGTPPAVGPGVQSDVLTMNAPLPRRRPAPPIAPLREPFVPVRHQAVSFASELQEPARVRVQTKAYPAPGDPARRTHKQNARGRVPFIRLAAAQIVDLLVVLAPGALVCLGEMLAFDGRWPLSKLGGLDALALWLRMYPATMSRALFVTVGVGLVYSAICGYLGHTVGRALFGLRLLRLSGEALSLPQAVLRALASLASAALFGAGFFWSLVDRRHRTWHDIISRCVVIDQHRTPA